MGRFFLDPETISCPARGLSCRSRQSSYARSRRVPEFPRERRRPVLRRDPSRVCRVAHDLRRIYTAGDLVLYPDVPEFVGLTGAPEHHHFIGTCAWSAHAPKPHWWNDLMASSQPKVFVSLGSSGPIKALPAVLEALSRLPVSVILSTSGRAVGTIPSNVYLADLLPYEETASRAAVVISHGGTGGVYPALSARTPMLAVPSNIDMHYRRRSWRQPAQESRSEWSTPRPTDLKTDWSDCPGNLLQAGGYRMGRHHRPVRHTEAISKPAATLVCALAGGEGNEGVIAFGANLGASCGSSILCWLLAF